MERCCWGDTTEKMIHYHDKIAEYTEADIQRIVDYPGMIRSPRKAEAVMQNVR